jgi:hypothetical protein
MRKHSTNLPKHTATDKASNKIISVLLLGFRVLQSKVMPMLKMI